MKNLIAFAFAVASGCAVAVYDGVTAEKYPDADSVLIDSVEKILYNPDGTSVSESTEIIKVLTEKGRREEARLEISYNKRYGKAEFTEVSVIGADGVERAIDFDATMKESSDNSSQDANIYDPMDRKISCMIPGVKVGEAVKYSIRRETFAARIENQWADTTVMEWLCPFLKRTVEITAPAERPLKSIALRHPIGNVSSNRVENADGSITWSWTAENSPQVFPEPDMPPLYTQVQHLRVSTAADWREISRWYWNLCLPHLEKINAEIKAQVAELAAKGATDEEKIAVIYRWVAQEIRYMGLTMEDSSPGYAPHDVDITFGNRYGVCRDKAGLLTAMLREAGLAAYPVLIHAGAKMDKDVPSPYFNHAIVAVHSPESPLANKDGYILMDPTDESSRDLLPAYLSDRSYLVAREDGETLLTSQIVPAGANAVTINSTATLNDDGSAFFETTARFTGINDNAYRGSLLRMKPADREKFFARVLNSLVPGAELMITEIMPEDLQNTAEPLAVRLIAKLPDLTIKGRNSSEFNPPLLSRTMGVANWLLEGKTSLATRKYPLHISSTAMVDETLTVKTGDSLGKSLYVPEDEKLEGKYSYERTCRVSEGELKFHRRLSFDAVELSPEEYADVRESIMRVEARARKRPVFASNSLALSNVRYLRNDEYVSFQGDNAWTVTNIVEKEILTYDGKKKSSELKFSYNPTWKKIEVVSATVSNLNGKVSRVSDAEMNEFDCGWASAAPRYPATRELVVNLPSVEVGSVIAYTVVTTVTNAPAPFRAVYCFDTVEPTAERTVKVGDWKRTATDLVEIANEPLTARGEFWRDCRIFAKGNFRDAAKKLRAATKVEAVKEPAIELDDGMTKREKVKAVRDWMAKNVRVIGPSLYETPLSAQLAAPAIVLRERYASRLDYVRTVAALLKGAGIDSKIVFFSGDRLDSFELQRLEDHDYPNIRKYSSAVVMCEPYLIGIENEYTPLETSAYNGSKYLDPQTGSLEIYRNDNREYETASTVKLNITVRENGAIDVDHEETLNGPAVGAFRKLYAEMLPEDRSRHFQKTLGELAQAATATRELVTDVEGYPAKLSYSAYVPDFAVAGNDALTVTVPEFYERLFPITASTRENPIGLSGDDVEETLVEVRFPNGYTEAEHLPKSYNFSDPSCKLTWCFFEVKSRVEGKGAEAHLTVTLRRVKPRHASERLSPEYAAMLKDWSRIASSRANRTITVRRIKN